MRLADRLRDVEEPTFRDRPIGLVGLAVAAMAAGIAITLSAVELFLGAMGYQDWTAPKVVSNAFVDGVTVYPEHYLLMGAMVLIPAGYLLALATGIALARGWAWILGFVAGGLIALYGVLALVIPDNADAGQERWHPGESLPWIVLGVGLLWYFDRRHVKRDLGWGDPAIG